MNARTTETLLQRAIAAHKGGRLNEAEAGYRAILRSRPKDPDALNFLGLVTFHQGQPGEAVAFLRRSIESNPDNPHPRINLGNILLARGEAAEAATQFTRASELAPELATAWYNLGVCLRQLKRDTEAVDCFFKALRREQGLSTAREALGRLLYRMGQFAQAAEVYRDWLQYEPDNPTARHLLAALTGEAVPERGSDEYVAALFDDFASTFDENLAELDYRAPALLCERLAQSVDGRGPLDILDAGCGTGLAAPLLKPLAQRLVGVDLSAQMLARARDRGMYDELAEGELTAFMLSRCGQFDVIVSADTLCYFGALEAPLRAAHQALRPGGTLVLSLEAWDAADPAATFDLQPHGRYRHAAAYVRATLAAAQFRLLDMTSAALRKERGEDVVGHVLLATAEPSL